MSFPILLGVRTFQIAGRRKNGSIPILMTYRTLLTGTNPQRARTRKSHPNPIVGLVGPLPGRIPLTVGGCRPTVGGCRPTVGLRPSPALRVSDFGRAAKDS